MKKVTTSEGINYWLRERLELGKNEVSTHKIELQLPTYGKFYHGVLHTPSTYTRVWRTLKSDISKLRDIDVVNIKVKPNGSVENTWILETYTSKRQLEMLPLEI